MKNRKGELSLSELDRDENGNLITYIIMDNKDLDDNQKKVLVLMKMIRDLKDKDRYNKVMNELLKIVGDMNNINLLNKYYGLDNRLDRDIERITFIDTQNEALLILDLFDDIYRNMHHMLYLIKV